MPRTTNDLDPSIAEALAEANRKPDPEDQLLAKSIARAVASDAPDDDRPMALTVAETQYLWIPEVGAYIDGDGNDLDLSKPGLDLGVREDLEHREQRRAQEHVEEPRRHRNGHGPQHRAARIRERPCRGPTSGHRRETHA